MRRDYSSLRQGLLGAWCPSLGATGYTLLDRSGRGNNGTLTNMAGQSNWPASGTGTAINFDGTNDVVIVPGSTAYLSAVWFSFWFRLTSALTASSGSQYVLFAANTETTSPFRQTMTVGFNLGLSGAQVNTGKLVIITYDNNATPQDSGAYTTQNFSSATGVWYHASGGWTGTAWRLFINGISDTNAINAGRASTSTPVTPMLIGSQNSFGRATPVQMDDLRIYNRALTQSEIIALASRRGIGLTPLRQRRTSASGRRLYANVAGTWKESLPMINVGGTWKEGAVYENVGGAWKN